MEKKKIMIVEDERIVAHDLARQLTDLGLQCGGNGHTPARKL